MLKAKNRLFSPVSDFYEGRQYVASYDGGPCTLIFVDGRSYSFSLWTPDWVKIPVFPKGSAKIACLADYHYEVVDDEASSDKIVSTENGEIIYYKENELEIVAHAETLLDNNSGVIVCNNKIYKVTRTKKRSGSNVAEIYENDRSIATIKSGMFRIKSIFKNKLSSLDRVFITLLAVVWR